MASLKNLLVLGSARFLNTIKGTIEKAEKLATSRTIQTKLDSTSSASFDGSANVTPGVSGILPVANGGTGVNTFTSGQALIGNGNGDIQTRAIRNNHTVDDIGWTSASNSTSLLTQNDIAYWNGRYNDSASNLKYAAVGEIKDAATHEVETTLTDDSNLPTGAAVKSYVDEKDLLTRTNLGLEGSLMSKTYTGIIGEANNAAGATFYAIKVVPDDYDKNWFIRYRVTAEIDLVSEANGLGHKSSEVYICGMKSTYANYWVWNTIRNTTYQAYSYNTIYRATTAGVTGGYGHVIGVGLRDSWNRLTAANTRTITVEILDYGDCTVSLFDQMLLYDDLPGTGSTNYNAITEFNGNTQGLTRSGTDANNYDRTVLYGAAIKAESAIVAGNVIVAGTSGHYHHLKLGTPFDITYPILYASKAIAANANSNSDAYISYMFNLDTTQPVTLTTQSPVFIKGQLDGTIFTPVSTTPCTQTIPTTEDGYEYIYLGQAYAANNIVLSYVHPIFAYRNGKWTEITGDASSINGHTVEKDVPSDAKFTDTNYHTPRCTTGASNAAKTAACADYVLLKDSYIPLLVINTNTANSALTLNINSTGAKPIWINGTASSSSNHTLPGGMYFVYYDGSKYYFRTDGKLPADISGDSATTNEHTLGHDEDENVVVAWDGGEVITPPASSALPISQGGTGATTAAAARTNLGLGSAATYNVVSSVNDDTNLPTGAAIKSYYEAVGIPSAICTTSAATAAKVATCSSYKLLANSYIQVIIANANTASSALTLNINSQGAKPIVINGLGSSSTNNTLPAGSYFVFYNGTNYYFRTDGKLTADITGDAATVNGHNVEIDVPQFETGKALVGNGADGIATRTIRNNTTRGTIGYTNSTNSTSLLTQNDIAFWDGRYSGSYSNLLYCNKGAFGTAATKNYESTVANDGNLPTGAAVTNFLNSWTGESSNLTSYKDGTLGNSAVTNDSDIPTGAAITTAITTALNNIAIRGNCTSSSPLTVTKKNNANYGVFMILGFAQGVGGIALLLKIAGASNISSIVNMFTGEAFSSTYLTFTYSSGTLTIKSTQADTSYFIVMSV